MAASTPVGGLIPISFASYVVQMGAPIKRIALLDDVSHHLRFQALINTMSDSEKETLRGVLQSVSAQELADLHSMQANSSPSRASIMSLQTSEKLRVSANVKTPRHQYILLESWAQ